MYLIDSIGLFALNRPWPFIFIGRKGLATLWVETLTNLVLKYDSNSDYTTQNWSDRSCELVCPRCRNSRSHISLIWSPNRMFHICILIVSTRSMQWWSLFYLLSNLIRLVWPVLETGLTDHPSRAIFWCEQKDSVLHSTRKEKLYLWVDELATVSATAEDINTVAVEAVSRNDCAIDSDSETNIQAGYLRR